MNHSSVVLFALLSIVYYIVPSNCEQITFYEKSDCTGQRHKFTLGDFDECINLPNSPDGKHWLNAGVDPPHGLCVKIFENSNCRLEHRESNIHVHSAPDRPNCKNLYNLGYFGTRSIQKVRCPDVHPDQYGLKKLGKYFNDN